MAESRADYIIPTKAPVAFWYKGNLDLRQDTIIDVYETVITFIIIRRGGKMNFASVTMFLYLKSLKALVSNQLHFNVVNIFNKNCNENFTPVL